VLHINKSDVVVVVNKAIVYAFVIIGICYTERMCGSDSHEKETAYYVYVVLCLLCICSCIGIGVTCCDCDI
jgi:hypothetical protein